VSIREARLAAGVTQRYAAAVAEMHVESYRRIELGLRKPSQRVLWALEVAFAPHLDGVSIETRERGRPRKAMDEPVPSAA